MRKFFGILAAIVLLALLASGAFADAINFFAWLFLLENTLPEISIGAEIAVRVLSFFVSYGLVGLIFSFFGLFNKKMMSLIYGIISSLVLIAGTYVVWLLEQHLIVVIVVLSIILSLTIIAAIAFVVSYFKKKKIDDSGNKKAKRKKQNSTHPLANGEK